MAQYKCQVCMAEFSSNQLPERVSCPACGEYVTERNVEYTDRRGTFTIGGKVERV